MKHIGKDVKELFEEPEWVRLPRHRKDQIKVAAIVGAGVGAVVGFVGLLVLFAMIFGDNAQLGFGALLIGVPAGGWAGAEVAARWEKG